MISSSDNPVKWEIEKRVGSKFTIRDLTYNMPSSKICTRACWPTRPELILVST